MSRPVRVKPRDLTPGWPESPSPEPIAGVARVFASNIRKVMNGRSACAVAVAAKINQVTLLATLDGRVWPDLATIAKRERYLTIDVWPGRLPFAGK
jgi:hypothetical protein